MGLTWLKGYLGYQLKIDNLHIFDKRFNVITRFNTGFNFDKSLLNPNSKSTAAIDTISTTYTTNIHCNVARYCTVTLLLSPLTF